MESETGTELTKEDCSINQIVLDPTQRIIVSSPSGCVKIVSIIKQEKQYVYVEMNNEYLTLPVNRHNAADLPPHQGKNGSARSKKSKDPEVMG